MRAALVASLLFASCATPIAAPPPSASAARESPSPTTPLTVAPASASGGRASPSPTQWYFDAVTQPGRRGGTASVTIHGAPGVQCTATFLWPGMPSAGQRVPPVTTDASGTAVFRWTVDPATPPGSWRIDATCAGQVFSTHVPID